jgi:hypothetical protein
MENNNHPTKEDIVNATKCIPDRAAKDGWVFTLDKEEGALYYSPVRIPSDAQLFQASDEFAIYLDSKKQIHGVMIEYVNANFLKHHIEFEDSYEELFESASSKKKSIITVKPTSRNKETLKFRNMLENVLIKDAVLENNPACAC